MNKLTIYYLLIAAIVSGKTVSTIYQRSVTIHHGSSVFEMQKEKQELQKMKLTLTAEMSKRNSLVTISTSDQLAEFQPINDTIILTSPSLASSQL